MYSNLSIIIIIIFYRLFDITYHLTDKKMYLVFEFVDQDLKKYIDSPLYDPKNSLELKVNLYYFNYQFF